MARNAGVLGAVLAVAMVAAKPGFAQVREDALLSPSGRLEVSLHGRSTQASARTERAAWITLSVPLDELARPRLAQHSVPSPPVPSRAAPEPNAAPTAPIVGASPSVTLEQLRALSEFSRRATVVALSVVGTAAERRRLDAIASSAKLSALLPELRLRALRNSDHALRWIPTTDDPYRITQADGTGLVLEASATFRLERLLFSHDALALERLRLEAGAQRLKLEARVLDALLALVRARELSCAEDSDDAEKGLQVLKVLELFVELDGLTAGWFADQAPAFGLAIWGFPEAAWGQCVPPGPRPARAVSNPVASLSDSE